MNKNWLPIHISLPIILTEIIFKACERQEKLTGFQLDHFMPRFTATWIGLVKNPSIFEFSSENVESVGFQGEMVKIIW